MPNPTASAVQQVRIEAIDVPDGHNPRLYFKRESMTRLVQSLREEGLIQAITVRPHPSAPSRFALVAGERRLRAAKTLQWREIPALVLSDIDEAHARRIALLENLDRADLSPAEEAMASRDVVDQCGGDVDLAARTLGWSVSKVRARLLLLGCSKAVLEAAGSGQITHGHAELLAGLPHANQDKALPRIIADDVSIAALKAQLKGFSIPLSRACFDLSGCQGCPHNSQTQGQLFGEALEGSHCQNRTCFAEKTEAAIKAKVARLRDEVGRVALATQKDPSTYRMLVRRGTDGVGPEQFAACRGCKHFGAIVHDAMDEHVGNVDRPVCFNLTCNRKKVAAYQASLAPAPAPAGQGRSGSGAGTGAATGSTGKRSTNKGARKSKAAVAGSPRAVREIIGNVYVEAIKADAVEREAITLALAIVGINSMCHGNKSEAYEKAVKGKRDSHALAALVAHSAADLKAILADSVQAFFVTKTGYFHGTTPRPLCSAVQLAQACKIDLSGHFTVDEAYLAAHTKAGIQALLEESGFKAWQVKQKEGKAAYKRLLANKKADLPKAVMRAGFDFSGFVPKAMATAKPSDIDPG
jgi:ParB family chromosome partitioning protein